LEIDVRSGDMARIAHDLVSAGLIASRTEAAEAAAKLHAAGVALIERVGAQFLRFIREWIGADLAALEERMGEASFVAASVAGREMRREDAVLLARSVLEPHPAITL
jgi:hypothetical protein